MMTFRTISSTKQCNWWPRCALAVRNNSHVCSLGGWRQQACGSSAAAARMDAGERTACGEAAAKCCCLPRLCKPCARHVQVLPPLEAINEVEHIARSYWADHPDRYIAIHCAYGER